MLSETIMKPLTQKEVKMKQATIYDISRKAGVSIATVSRVLNDNSKVSAKTKAKVLAVMEEYEYEPNVFARGLGTGSMKTIGILCADVADIYLANAVSFLERELSREGFDTLLNCTGYEYKDKVKCMRMMESHKVDAVIMVGSHYIEECSRRNGYIMDVSQRIPVMLLNGYLDGENIYCNLSDDYGAFYEATKRLTGCGRRRILFLRREVTNSSMRKQSGYEDALKACGLEVDPELVLPCNHRIQSIKLELEDYFETHPMVDGVMACDDELAIGAMKYFQEKCLNVPEDISIIGCNNSVLSICSEPELTSIDNMCEVVCVNTVSMLMRVLEQQKVAPKTLLSCRFVERGTTRNAKSIREKEGKLNGEKISG